MVQDHRGYLPNGGIEIKPVLGGGERRVALLKGEAAGARGIAGGCRGNRGLKSSPEEVPGAQAPVHGGAFFKLFHQPVFRIRIRKRCYSLLKLRVVLMQGRVRTHIVVDPERRDAEPSVHYDHAGISPQRQHRRIVPSYKGGEICPQIRGCGKGGYGRYLISIGRDLNVVEVVVARVIKHRVSLRQGKEHAPIGKLNQLVRVDPHKPVPGPKRGLNPGEIPHGARPVCIGEADILNPSFHAAPFSCSISAPVCG